MIQSSISIKQLLIPSFSQRILQLLRLWMLRSLLLNPSQLVAPISGPEGYWAKWMLALGLTQLSHDVVAFGGANDYTRDSTQRIEHWFLQSSGVLDTL